MSDRLPPVDKSLIEWLERRFPNQVPDPEDSDRQVWIKVGHQEVIKDLRRILEKIIAANLKAD